MTYGIKTREDDNTHNCLVAPIDQIMNYTQRNQFAEEKQNRASGNTACD